MKNNLLDLSEELIKDIQSLEGFSSPLIEEELVSNLAIKLDAITADEKDERIMTMRNMFALGQVFNLKDIKKDE